MSGGRPPRLAERLLGLVLWRGRSRDTVLGDLHELFMERRLRSGPFRARLWYWRSALAIAARSAVARAIGVGSRSFRGVRSPVRATLGALCRDAGFALRSYRRAPGFLAVAILTLALGVGANTAVFTVIHGVFLRPLAFPSPDRLVRVGLADIDGSLRPGVHTAGSHTYWKERAHSFQALAAHAYRTVVARRGDVAESILTVPVVGPLFEVLGVEAAVGRTFGATDRADERLAVLSHAYWRQAFGADRGVLGRALEIDGVPFTVVGVMPEGFAYPHPAARAWITANLDGSALRAHDDFYLRTVARLAEGRTLEQARAEMEDLAVDLRRMRPDVYGDLVVPVVPLRDMLVGDSGALWSGLMAGVGLVLLIGCLNLANMFLSRTARRQSEIAVRRALGASRGRLVRQLVTEGLLLGGLGGMAGLATGWAFLEGILAWMPGGVPRVEAVRIDGTVVAFALGVSLLTALAFSAVPAWRAGRSGLQARFRDSRGTWRVLDTLVALEVGLAVVLLAVGGLTVRSFLRLSAEDAGVHMEDRWVTRIKLPNGAPDAARFAFFRALEERLAGLPRVRAVGIASTFPVADFTPGAWINGPGVQRAGGERPGAKYQAVSPGYFDVLGIPLIRGRKLTRADGVEGTPSVVISRTAQRELFGGRDPIGRRFDMGLEGSAAPLSTVVGVVGDVRLAGLGQPAPAAVFGVQELMPWWPFGYEVFIHAEPGADLAGAVREAVRELDPRVPFLGLRDARAEMAGSLDGQRNVMWLFGLLALVALVMATVGVSGVLSVVVGQRTREIGIRIAVGADRRSVRALVLRKGMGPVVLGAGAGVGAALVLGRFLRSLLYGVAPGDPVTLASVAALLLGVAAVAVYLPARRASGLDPVRVLSAD